MGNGPLRSIDTWWIDNADYVHLFQQFRTAPTDPEVVLVAALLHSDGTVTFRPWYFLPSGTADQSVPGNYAVRVLDNAGQTLAELTLPISFTIHVEPLGIQPTDTVPLLVAIPYGNTAATIEIMREGQVLTTVSTTSKLLQDAIDAIPDFGFIMAPSQRRNALHNKVNAIEHMLTVGNTMGAQQALVSDVRPTVERWLVDGYIKTQPVQLEKNEVLAVIDAMIERVGQLGK